MSENREPEMMEKETGSQEHEPIESIEQTVADLKKKIEELTEEQEKAAEETKAIELVQKHFGKDAVHVLQMFMELNQTGQQKVLEDLSDMTELSKYTEKRETALKNA